MKNLDENTSVPIRVIWVLAGALVGGTFWLTTMFVQLAMAQGDLKSLRESHDAQIVDEIHRRDDINEKLNRISSDLRLIKDRLKIQN